MKHKNIIKKKSLFLIIIFLIMLPLHAQKPELDSLFQELQTQQNDTFKVKTLNRIARVYMPDNFVKCVEYAEESRILSEMLGFTYGLANAYNTMGECFHTYQMYVDAIENYLKAETQYKETKGREGNLIKLYNNLGMCYSQLNLHKDALHYQEKAVVLIKEFGDRGDLGRILNNLFISYKHLKEYKKAEEAYKEAYAIFKEENFERGQAILNGNMATLFIIYQEYDSAITYTKKALEYGEKIGDNFSISMNNLNLAEVYNCKKEHKKAEILMNISANALEKVIITGVKDSYSNNSTTKLLSAIYKEFSNTYFLLGKYKEAYETRLNYETLNDSLFNSDLAQKLSESETKYKNYQSLKEIDLLKKEQELSDLQNHKNRILLFSSSLIIILLLLLSGLFVQRFKAKNKINFELTKKNSEILLQKKEITDSINYAKRIQEAILPPTNFVNAVLPNSFIFYKPKDIVSGDFYWVDKVNDYTYFAAVDCTGHGVPGAMMSVLGFNLITQAVHEKDKKTPAEILGFLDWGVNKTLRQSDYGSTVKDGMDLALCCLNNKTLELQYAGVQNPLYVVIQTENGSELKEIKADKSPIGINNNGVIDVYSNHTIQLKRGDCVYIFSDGYADQMGGEKGKKFMYKPLRNLLISIANKEIPEQFKIIEHTFYNWKKDYDQIDDVLLIGVKV
jgi:serine phosphatase RsbU (regulator of sigma subunit)/tetratricopeptide (TPR) repeat protein